MNALTELAIVIPARDEAQLIARCLSAVGRSISAARRRFGRTTPGITTIVVADGCTDATVDIASRFAGVRVIDSAPVGVGAARARGADAAMSAFSGLLDSAWLAHTDADSIVHRRWIIEQIEAAVGGADVYIGDVRPDFGDLDRSQRLDWLATHPDGAPRGHVHGANLGVRASAYAAVGGFDARTTGEDVALVSRLREAGYSFEYSGTEIITSGRRQARAPEGYARYLAVELPRLARESTANGLPVCAD